MTLSDIDWRLMRGTVILLAVCVAVGGALYGTSFYYWQETQKQLKRDKGRLTKARQRYQALDEEKRMIVEYLPQFRALEKAGIIGAEHRLNWLETLRGAVQHVKLPSLSYGISSQDWYVPDFPLKTGFYEVFVSHMRLDMGLLHEGDLLAILEQVDQHATGLYNVAGCRLDRKRTPFASDPKAVNVDARCGLRWLTIQPKDPGKERGRR